MNETFQLRRFWQYFRYDFMQVMRSHGRPLLLFAGLGLFYFLVQGLLSLSFSGTWSYPGQAVRIGMFVVVCTVMELYIARIYGHLTDRKAGSAWLLVPASRLEKYISMLLMVLVVIPVCVWAIYLAVDALLVLVFPAMSQPVVGSFFSGLSTLMQSFAEMSGSESPIVVSPAGMVGILLLGHVINFLFFLLCGLCFRKYKISGGLLVIFILSMVLSILSALALIPTFQHLDFDAGFEDEQALRLATSILNGFIAVACLVAAGLGWGVWRRIKTLQH